MSTIALCIPAYNAAWCLPRLLKSAQNQIIPFDEILVYNDCSSDNTIEVAQSYNVKVITGSINRGCSYGKNRLAEETQCEWVHFHDADDEIKPNFTSLAHRWISLPHPPDVVLFNYEYRDNDTNELLSIRCFDPKEIEQDAILYSIKEQINPFCGLYNRKKFLEVGGYDTDPKVLYNEDVAFHCKLAIAGLKFSSEGEVSIINYRVDSSMSSSNKVKCAQAHFEVMKKNATNTPPQYHASIAHKLWLNAGVSASLLDWETTEKSISLAKSLDPKVAAQSNMLFRLLCVLNPYAAFRIREAMIRILKPSLRRS